MEQNNTSIHLALKKVFQVPSIFYYITIYECIIIVNDSNNTMKMLKFPQIPTLKTNSLVLDHAST